MVAGHNQDREQHNRPRVIPGAQESQEIEPLASSNDRTGPPQTDDPPAYADLHGTPSALGPEKPSVATVDDHDLTSPSGSELGSDDTISVEDDDEVWELDEILTPSESDGLPSYAESEALHQPVEELVREVMQDAHAAQRSTPGTEIAHQKLPYPVLIPQRRPHKKSRGFVRAYAPSLNDCGISQGTFLRFLNGFHKSSQDSPIFPTVRIAASSDGLTPGVIAMAVATAVQASPGAEVQTPRTNDFFSRMNQELFIPAGLYAMIIKYKSDAGIGQSANRTGHAHCLIMSELVDLSSNQIIAKDSGAVAGHSASSSSTSVVDRVQDLRLASNVRQDAIVLPGAAPLVFPDIDRLVEKHAPERYKHKSKEVQKFLADYLDRKAQVQYVQQDSRSALTVTNSHDSHHSIHSGGLFALSSGGKSNKRMEKRERKMEKHFDRFERKMDKRVRKDERRARKRYGDEYVDGVDAIDGDLQGEGRDSRGFGQDYAQDGTHAESSGSRRPLGLRDVDENDGSPSTRASARLSRAQDRVERRQERRAGGSIPLGTFGTFVRAMREDVLYLMIVNMPSETEVAEAREELARAR